MTDTTTARLPTDLGLLKAYLPAQPESTVTRTLDGIARIDTAIASVREELTARDEADHRIVSDVVNASMGNGNLAPVAARITLGDRPTLEHKLEQLRLARSLAAHRHSTAARTDPIHLRWVANCKAITDEWQLAMSGDYGTEDSDDARFQRLVAFVERHTPS